MNLKQRELRGFWYDDAMTCPSALRLLFVITTLQCDLRQSIVVQDGCDAESNLPPLLRRHASSLRDVHSPGGHVNTSELHSLYARVIWDALRQTPVVLVLENADLVDTESLIVLRLLVSKLGGSGATDGTADVATIPKHTSILLCTVCEMHSLGVQDPPRQANALHDKLLEQNVIPLQLEPLADAPLLELAQLMLGSPLSESIAAFLLGRLPNAIYLPCKYVLRCY